MKTRNWKLCTFIIFLAVCFILCVGNCYAQGRLPEGKETGEPPVFPDLVPDPWRVLDSPPDPWYLKQYPGPTFPLPNLIDFTWPMYVWTPPAGRAALDIFQDLMPQLTYEAFYGRNSYDYYNPENLYDDYSGYPGPMTDTWYLYQRTDIHSRPKAGEQTLYQFTKDFLVQPRKPDILTPYGSMGGYAGLYGMGGSSGYNMGAIGSYSIGGYAMGSMGGNYGMMGMGSFGH